MFICLLEHDHDTPGNGPLLETNQTTTLGWRCDLRDIDRNLSRADTHAEAVDDTTNDQHGNVLGGADNDRTNTPVERTLVRFLQKLQLEI